MAHLHVFDAARTVPSLFSKLSMVRQT